MKLVQLFLALILILNMYEISLAYDDKKTHPSLTDNAIERSILKTGKFLSKNLGDEFLNETESTIYGKKIITWLEEGSTEEDTPDCRAASHFLNPLKDWDLAGLSDTNETIKGFFTNSICFSYAPFSSRFSLHKYSDVTWATGYTSPSSIFSQPIDTDNEMDWNAARQYYRLALTATNDNAREEYFAKSFLALGHVIHLLQDMAVPAHVRNDFTAHLAFQRTNGWWFPNWYGNTYEWFVKDQKNIIQSAISGDVNVVPPPDGLLTALWDTNKYDGSNPSTDTEYDHGLAEYTNANFFSESTIFAERKDQDDIHYFPRPSRNDTNVAEIETNAALMEVTAEDGGLDRSLYILSNNGNYKMANPSLLKKWIDYQSLYGDYLPEEYIYQSAYNLDDEVYKDYAKRLLPRAVGYSTGLIDYFFRGQLETTALEKMDDNGNVTELLVNVTNKTANETMKNGYFTLAYRYKPSGSTQYVYGTQLFPLDEMAYDSSKQLTFKFSEYNPDYPSQTTLSPIPAGATDKQYTLVFYGTLGNETNAVVGKVFEPTPAAIDITRPGRFVYALADDGGTSSPKGFKKLRAKLRDNAPAIEMTGGVVTATARFKQHLKHMDDLSTEPPYAEDRSYEFYSSTSLPIAVSLDNLNATEVEFDFSAIPIPFGVTDLSLEVAYQQGDATTIAFGTKDLNEPQYIGVWNARDRFLIDLDPNTSDSIHDWRLMTEAEIMDDPALVEMLDEDDGGLIDAIIDPVAIDVDVYFAASPPPALPATYHATFNQIPAGRFGRVAFIADQANLFTLFHEKHTSSYPDSSAPGDYLDYDGRTTYFMLGVTNQSEEGTYCYTPIYSFRGIKNHFSYISVGRYPEPSIPLETFIAIKEANWPAPMDTAPVPAAAIHP